MTRPTKWVLLLIGAAVVVYVAVGLLALISCEYHEGTATYSSDGRFYSQMQLTECSDPSKSKVRLVLGEKGKDVKTTLIEFVPESLDVHVSWQAGPELHVEAPPESIAKRFGPYDGLPPVRVSSPPGK